MSTPAPARWMHAGYTVRSLDRLLPFLEHCLGFEVLSVGPPQVPGILARIVGVAGADARIAYAMLGGHTIELLEYTAPEGRSHVSQRPCDVGAAHFAVDVHDVPETIIAAARHGFMPVAPPVPVPAGPNAGRLAVYLRDDDGFTVELIGGPGGSS